jgi:hypothetical protein
MKLTANPAFENYLLERQNLPKTIKLAINILMILKFLCLLACRFIDNFAVSKV